MSTHHCSAAKLTRNLGAPCSTDELERDGARGEKDPEGIRLWTDSSHEGQRQEPRKSEDGPKESTFPRS